MIIFLREGVGQFDTLAICWFSWPRLSVFFFTRGVVLDLLAVSSELEFARMSAKWWSRLSAEGGLDVLPPLSQCHVISMENPVVSIVTRSCMLLPICVGIGGVG